MEKSTILAISSAICAVACFRSHLVKARQTFDRVQEELRKTRAECAELREKFTQASASRDANEAIIAQLSVCLAAANGQKTVEAARLKEMRKVAE